MLILHFRTKLIALAGLLARLPTGTGLWRKPESTADGKSGYGRRTIGRQYRATDYKNQELANSLLICFFSVDAMVHVTM